jgi:hypothetical protein
MCTHESNSPQLGEDRILAFDLAIANDGEQEQNPTVSHWWEIFIDQLR